MEAEVNGPEETWRSVNSVHSILGDHLLTHLAQRKQYRVIYLVTHNIKGYILLEPNHVIAISSNRLLYTAANYGYLKIT